jgi:fatty acid desaturase
MKPTEIGETAQSFDPPPTLKSDILTREELSGLMEIRHGRVVFDMVLFWVAILGSLEAALYFHSWWVSVLVFLIIGCLQNALITWTHEASHCSLHRNRKINDWIADLFLAGPGGISVKQYRWHHVNHHKYLGDPEKEIELVAWLCLRGGNLFAQIAKHLLGGAALAIVRRKQRFSQPDSPHRPPPPRSLPAWIGFIGVNGALFAMCALQGQWWLYFLLWVLPLFTIAMLISNFRTIVEHQASADVCDLGRVPMTNFTRMIETNPIERFLIAPVGFYYHLEHHLYPSVPYHRLGELRRLLKKKGYFNDATIVKERGYLRTLWRLAMQPGFGLRLLNPFRQMAG